MDAVDNTALDWALTHVRRFGDTDIFPVPFEFDAISHAWIALRRGLAARDLGNLRMRTARRYLVPKPGGGFRVAIQLDPLDTLTYTALVYEMAPALEKSRIGAQERIACSYRIQLEPTGSFFPLSNGWRDFHQRSAELSASGHYSHVLLADISDFYNQIYHHRIENALESAAIAHDRAQNVEALLSRLTAKQSRGLPVGPSASILLAEMCLNDVDTFLLRKRAVYVRYVDDFRIFCGSRREAVAVHHDLVDYLYTAHRLSLESSKTKVVHVETFKREELRDPEEQEQRIKVERFDGLMKEFFESIGPYDDAMEQRPEEDEMASEATRDALLELFGDCVGQPPLHLGLARHLLRRATSMHTAILHDRVFKNLEMLAPALRDVARYLVRTLPKKSLRRGQELLRFLGNSDLGSLPFVRLWALEIIEQKPQLVPQQDALKIAEESIPTLGIRPFALLARKYGVIDWVRAQKETWTNHGDWDRRAIIWSASALPTDERRHWLDLVQDTGDSLDRAVAQFAAIQ
jgi:hypothetical protein